jgi:hypothetical protein
MTHATIVAALRALSCSLLAGPWTGRDPVQYKVAGILIGIGVVLWVVTVLINRARRQAGAAKDGDRRHSRAGEPERRHRPGRRSA